MKLQEVFDQLTYGEFSQLSIGGQAAGVINSSNHNNLLGHLNLGLTALFTRFNLKEVKLSFPLDSEADTYQIVATDLIKIEKVLTDGDLGLPLNVSGDVYSCFTPTMSSLYVPPIILAQDADTPYDLLTTNLTVVYRANHPKLALTLGVINPATTEIELPATHLVALLYFVASRINNPIGMTNEFHAGNSYFAKYEQACQDLENKGIQIDQGNFNDRLARNGWV